MLLTSAEMSCYVTNSPVTSQDRVSYWGFLPCGSKLVLTEGVEWMTGYGAFCPSRTGLGSVLGLFLLALKLPPSVIRNLLALLRGETLEGFDHLIKQLILRCW